jgi:hypothetical protein
MIAKTKTRTNVDTTTKTVAGEIDKIVIVSITVTAGVIGIWSLACLFGGLIAAGGPIALVKGFFVAIAAI